MLIIPKSEWKPIVTRMLSFLKKNLPKSKIYKILFLVYFSTYFKESKAAIGCLSWIVIYDY
jgi:hypothetical protein